ncbi:hypothetical protein GCM10009128_24330 [Psychrosphaera haliotis]|uniref:hypothetical protein n=1 Tax=Psychrosphaera haliotis TaxID=555083 RepID=UPI0031D37176
MRSLSRRDMLKLITASSTVLGLPLSHFTTTSSTNDQTLDELVCVHRAWLKSEVKKAEDYLSSLPQSSLLHASSLKKLISKDFSQGHIIYVNGLMLSRTEVAISSYYLEQFSKKPNKV